MTTTQVKHHCRFCNCLIRNICISMVAEKSNLSAKYNYYDEITELGIPLFTSGEHTYEKTVEFGDDKFNYVIDNDITTLKVNLDGNECFFQEQRSIEKLYKYLRSEKIMKGIIEKNPYREFYGKNNCYVHVRLGDVPFHNPGFHYYDKVISSLNCKNIFISSDSINDDICKNIIKKYGAIIVDENEVRTIQFGSTCRNIVLSNGSFSSMIGYLSFYADKIFYPRIRRAWHGELFCIPGWICVDF